MSKWISIKDKLPAKDEEVLIYGQFGTYVGWLTGELDVFKQPRWCYSYCCGCYTSEITHWQELPEAPKTEA